MSFTAPAALWLLTLAVPVLALHILRSRRTQVTVSSTYLWDAVDRPVAAARPWQRLRASLPLLLQLLLVALLATALAGPALDTGETSAEHLVVILDTSASMGANDGSPSRLDQGVDVVEQLVGDLGDGAVVSLITAGAPARVLASGVDGAEVRNRLDAVVVSEGGFDGESASSLALGMDQPDRSVQFVLVGDGGLDAAAIRLLPAGTEFHPVGRRDRNLGVTNIVVSETAELMHLQVQVTNSGSAAAGSVVRVDVDGVDVASSSIEVPRSQSTEIGFDVPGGEQIAVHLDTEDLLASDNHAYAVGPEARTLAVLRVGQDDPFLDALLEGRDSLEVTHVTGLDELAAPELLSTFDLIVFDRVDVPDTVPVPWLAFAPPGGAPGVAVQGEVEAPVPALVRSDTDLLSGLDLGQLAVGVAQVVDAPAATTLVGAERTPLIVSGSAGGVAFVYVGVALDQTNLGLLPAFPVLGDRILTTLGGASLSAGSLQVGEPLPLEPGVDVAVVSPAGVRTEVRAGAGAPELDRTGIWRVEPIGAAEDTDADRLVVVNPSPSETDLVPRDALAIPTVEGDLGGDGLPVRRSLVPWLLGAALVVVAAEWWSTARRRGVGRAQWRVAQFARGAIAAMLLLALLVPTISRPSGRVGVVLVVDVSDSMSGGRERAVELVHAAIERMPAGSVAGVVAVGATARVDAAVQESLEWSGIRVELDGSATDLAAGVRVAGAMLPGDHARRVVLVSDGRPTLGDLDAELTRLQRSGVQLDVIPVETASGPDLMVVGVEVADRARRTDQVPVRVRVAASEPQPATVVLRRDDLEVERRLVDLPAGTSVVEFLQPAGEPGTVRWTAEVSGPSNGRVQNDVARASTRVEGRAQILMVEGAEGEAGPLAQAVGASGAAVTIVEPELLPDLAGLAANDAVVLVDVPLTALSADQVARLVTATRELGTGLVTVGGSSSYGAGEYLGSPLEEILPVVSEVKDPKRRSKVAQVFAVDLSGSMGACHCAEDAAGANGRMMDEGGVVKTDIARSAALRALEGIEPTDELGVLGLDDQHHWVRDLAPVGDGAQAQDELSELEHGSGGTNLEPGLSASAERLRSSDAGLRHIVLFTDGFEEPASLGTLADEAAALRDEGITVSVMGTGEGASNQLRAIADAGGGRYYPGRDLHALPNLLLQETKVVSRQLLVEGDFVPEVTSAAAVVAGLQAAPHVGGYIATTAKPTATQHLRVGEERDPLLASWQVGLGRIASWTSDAGSRWAGGWVAWEGAPAFWADVVRSVQRDPAGSLQARFVGADAEVLATFDEDVPDGAQVRAVVVAPDGTSSTVALDRVDARNFEAVVPTGATGSYAVGVTAVDGQGTTVAALSGVAELGYSREYSGEPADRDALEAASLRTGGRGVVGAAEAFDPDGLEPGRRTLDLRWALLLVALLAWPVAIALSRLRLTQGPDAVLSPSITGRVGSVGTVLASARGRRAAAESERRAADVAHRSTAPDPQAPPARASGPPATAPAAPSAPTSEGEGPDTETGSSALDSLLAARRARRRSDGPGT